MRYILILSLFLVSSCSLNPTLIVPSDTLLSDCLIAPPPTLTGNDSKDKLILASAWTNQTSNLGKCAQQIKILQSWKKVNVERFGNGK